MPRFLTASLQAKLIGAFVLVVVVALGVSGVVFVRVRNEDARRERLDRVAAESGAINTEFTASQFEDATLAQLSQLADELASERDVRILLVESSLKVAYDTSKDLTGQTLQLPPERDSETPAGSPFLALSPQSGTPGEGLTIVISRTRSDQDDQRPSGISGNNQGQPGQQQGPPGGFGGGPIGQGVRGGDRARDTALTYQVMLAVPRSDLADAWLGVLPNLGLAAGIALPVAVLLAVLLAQYITRPLRRLTSATHLVSEGRFDVDVASGRRDEVGQLATSFASMTQRVGAAQAQMQGLMADVSHNLKTPLTSILGFSRALETGEAEEPATVQRMGRVIHEEAERLAERLEDLLLLSEMESGDALLQRAPVDIGALVAAVAERVFAGEQRARLVLDAAPGLLVSADAAKLERAFENLVQNAAKFAPGGEAVRVVARADASGGATVAVANAAPGLEAEELPRLFDRFYRGQATRANRRVAGTGLGLAIARDIARLHGGDITASLEGGLVTFTVSLPGSAGRAFANGVAPMA
jgi:signal transduction histidine kinase